MVDDVYNEDGGSEAIGGQDSAAAGNQEVELSDIHIGKDITILQDDNDQVF